MPLFEPSRKYDSASVLGLADFHYGLHPLDGQGVPVASVPNPASFPPLGRRVPQLAEFKEENKGPWHPTPA